MKKTLSFVTAATLLMALFATAKPQPSTPAPIEAFNAFWSAYNKHYALFGIKRVDWDKIYKIYRPKVTHQTSDKELFNIFSDMLRPLNDIHVTLQAPQLNKTFRSGGRSIAVGNFNNGEFSLQLIKSTYMQNRSKTRAGGEMTFGWLQDNIGYLHLRSFKYPTSSVQAIDEVIKSFEHAKAIVIDVRHNSGGSDKIAQTIASRFVAEKHMYMSVTNRKFGDNRHLFHPPVSWYLEPSGPVQFNKPLVLLINSRSISAAENFAMAIKTLPNATVIGDTTAGVMADTLKMQLANGWKLGIPFNIMRDVNGVCWEGVGITPDLWVRNLSSDIKKGRDRLLDFAIELISAD